MRLPRQFNHMITPNEPTYTVNIPPSNLPTAKIQGSATIPVVCYVPQGVGKSPKITHGHITVTPETVLKWQLLQKRDKFAYRLTTEKLGNNSTSLCVEHKTKGDVQITLVRTLDQENKPTDFAQHFTDLILAHYKQLIG